MTIKEGGLEYWICDVFTDTQLAGNPLAVFCDAGDLSTEKMQAIAREMNLSETTFLIRNDENWKHEEGLRVRIFTTLEELPFAGHPTLGTAAMVRRFLPHLLGKIDGAGAVILNLKAGLVPVRFERDSLHGEMTQPDATFGKLHDPHLVAEALGLAFEDLAAPVVIQTVSTGVPFAIVPLKNLAVLSRLQTVPASVEKYLRNSDAKFFYCIARESESEWRARMQFYNGEDPATGSAAGCAIAYLVEHGLAQAGVRVHLRQGVEMGRPSDLYLSAQRNEDRVTEVRVGGSTVLVATGHFFLA